MTQPVYDPRTLERFLDDTKSFGLPIMVGILPLASARNAEFLHNEVPGITSPDEARAAMHEAGDRAAEVGLEQSLALLEAVGDAVSGTYIMPSFGRYEQCAELVRRIRTAQGVRASA